ncbi:MAG: Nodulation protein NfeD [Ignavibacteria bacterium]|nr:Nodulation protein NfeD [Ignavibacteria bacterium]
MKKLYLFLIIGIFISYNTSLARGKVVLINVEGAISPATSAYITRGLHYSEECNANALIISLNTPGGLMESTRTIVTNMLASKIPTIVYVSPSGSRAGSAGVFITLAANIAAMAPSTNIGAAHPVGLSGDQDTASVMNDKVTNDAAAFIRTIAQTRHKNVEWAERTVRESISNSEREALAAGAIDIIAPNIDSLLIAINGLKVECASKEIILQTADTDIDFLGMNWRDKLLALLSNPNIAYGLLMLGIYGIMFELYSPGAIFPGVAGAISIIIAAYSLQMMPVNYAGLGLIILAVVLFILEIKVVSHGLLSIGAVIALFIGSVMLVDSPGEFMEISLSVILTVVLFSVLFFGFIITLGIKAQKRRHETGSEAMQGESGIVVIDIPDGKTGKVKVHGELWKAKSNVPLSAGDEVIIRKCDGMTLWVDKGK